MSSGSIGKSKKKEEVKRQTLGNERENKRLKNGLLDRRTNVKTRGRNGHSGRTEENIQCTMETQRKKESHNKTGLFRERKLRAN